MPPGAVQENELSQQCLEHLRALPFVRRASLKAPKAPQARTTDFDLVLETPESRYTLPCEVKRSHVGQDVAQAVLHVAESRPGLVLFAPAVGRDLANTFERAGVNFVDALGNCYVSLGHRYIARIQGRGGASRKRLGKSLRAPAYRALLALMIRPELIDTPSRTMAAEAGVSPQTANDLRKYLVEQGLVLATRNRYRWAPARRRDAVMLWVAGFSTTLAPSLAIGRFRAKESNAEELEKRIEPILTDACEWRYGGGAASQRLTGYYRGDRTVLYVRNPPGDLANRLRFIKDDAGPILLARDPGRLSFESPHPACVHTLVAYADLLAEADDRAREAAGQLYETFIAPEPSNER